MVPEAGRVRLDDCDQLLVERLKQGDMNALGDMYLKYGTAVKGALKRFSPEMAVADVEEVCQEVFLAAVDGIKRYQEQLKLGGWLIGIAVKKSRGWRRRTWLRRRLLEHRASDVSVTALPSTATPDTTLEHYDEIRTALAALSGKQREVVLLRAVEGLSCDDIAAVLEIRVGVVWSRLRRARQSLLKQREAGDMPPENPR